jgi:hypothetical protein
MQKTVLSVLTDPSARKETIIKQAVSQEYSAGSPWFNAEAE